MGRVSVNRLKKNLSEREFKLPTLCITFASGPITALQTVLIQGLLGAYCLLVSIQFCITMIQLLASKPCIRAKKTLKSPRASHINTCSLSLDGLMFFTPQHTNLKIKRHYINTQCSHTKIQITKKKYF